MWHIILIGYIFVTLMFSIAQYPQGLARVLIYLVFWTVLPTLFSVWVVLIRRRNKRMKLEEMAEQHERDKAAWKQFIQQKNRLAGQQTVLFFQAAIFVNSATDGALVARSHCAKRYSFIEYSI